MSEILNFLDEQIDRESIRRYIHAVHAQDADGRGFSVWAEKRESGAWKQKGYLWSDLLQHVRKIDAQGQKNLYLSLQTFCSPFRRAENLFRLNAIGFDIDFHQPGVSEKAVLAAYAALQSDLADVLPAPSMAIFTGRGLQLLYLLEPLPKQGLPLWRMVGQAMASRIQAALARSAAPVKGSLDSNYSDVTRVLRLPGTYNSAAGRYSRILSPQQGQQPARYRLDALRDAYLPELLPGPKKTPNRPAPKKPTNRPAPLFNIYSLHMARLEDLRHLQNMRQKTQAPEDYRRRMVFLHRYWACFCMGKEAALAETHRFNAGFFCPLPSHVLERDTKSAEIAYEKWIADHKKGYNYKNTTLIDFLDIRPEEQKALKTLIDKAEKSRRQKEHGWYNEKRRQARSAKKARAKEEVRCLLLQGHTRRRIRQLTGRSFDFIAGVARETKRPPRAPRRPRRKTDAAAALRRPRLLSRFRMAPLKKPQKPAFFSESAAKKRLDTS